ncbi:STAS-like domain-containing protein [Ralstonia pseudosolanacearum]|uniref:STAS-like domain-containing protein n=1 Tax=Ralstonia pseudosolanacearum TaxID=1310165 RepID=UPI000B78E538|nr:STAS-like domain-containing protein [Ralstonia pseudosolanacearum]BCL90673.1 hypothetical protein MAFF211479_03740 [Ralstonia solanacearum]BCN03237.1 hypothetical protein RPSB_03740 [Ralstonia solanacearum]
MKSIAFAPEYTDLASRFLAAELRVGVAEALQRGRRVTIDLVGVLSMSESYADEAFGVLAEDLGIEKFVQVVSIKNANPHILRVIAKALKDRLAPSNSSALASTVRTLVVRRDAQKALAYS